MAWYGVGDGWCFSCGGFQGHVKLTFGRGTSLTPEPPVTPIGMGKATRGVDLAYDMLENSVYRPGDRVENVRAQNLNTIDEVPDSSWFTNRIGTRQLSIEELVRGPNRRDGPDQALRAFRPAP